MKECLKLKGLLQSEDGGETWFVARIDYLSGADTPYEKFDFIDVPKEWEPCQLVLIQNRENNKKIG